MTDDRANPDQARKGGDWYPGQMSLHPMTQVQTRNMFVPAFQALHWCMVPVTWRGLAWWYGWAPVVRDGAGPPVCGWWLLPRDPEEVKVG